MKWTRGRATVDRLLAESRLEPVSGAAADGTTWLVSAEALLESARRESARNPEAAYVLAYDAARKAWTALVVQQGLRPKTVGHHVTVEQVVRALYRQRRRRFGPSRPLSGPRTPHPRPGFRVPSVSPLQVIRDTKRTTGSCRPVAGHQPVRITSWRSFHSSKPYWLV